MKEKKKTDVKELSKEEGKRGKRRGMQGREGQGESEVKKRISRVIVLSVSQLCG